MPATHLPAVVAIWAPGLLASMHRQAIEQGLSVSELETALSRSDHEITAHPYAGYLTLHQKSQAQLAAIADGISCDGVILRADPVRLVPDVDRLVCQPVAMQTFTDSYLRQLLDAFNQIFAEDNMQLLMSEQKHWYLCLAEEPQVGFTNIQDVLQQNIDVHLPVGDKATYWRKLLNETQMLFHQINQQQGMNASSCINSIWPWCGDDTSDAYDTKPCQVMSNDPVLRGAAKLSDYAFLPLANEWQDLNMQPSQETLFIDLSSLPASQVYHDWLMPAIHAVKQRQLGALKLVDGEQCFMINRKVTSRWWRRTRPLTSFF